MTRWLRLLGLVLWIACYAACGEDAAPPAATGPVAGGPGTPAPISEAAQGRAPIEVVIVGTGEVTGPYYLIGDAIAVVVNKKASAHHLHCTVESTGGSLFNVHAVLAGDQQFGLVQSRRNHEAAKGLGNWKARGAQKELRSIFSLPFDPAPPAAGAADTDPAATDAAGFMGMTTMVTSAKVPDRVVYNFTRAVCENLSTLQDLHPAFKGLTPQRMIEGLSAPIHPGALKYYQEAGWMQGEGLPPFIRKS